MAKRKYTAAFGKKKRYAKKRKFARRRRTFKRRSVTSRQKGTAYSKSQIVKLKYCEIIQINPAVATASGYVHSANGLYDPNITGGGHQPLAFDQWMNFYDHYHVLGSKLTATFTSTSTDPTLGAANVMVMLRDTSSSLTGFSQFNLMEQPSVYYKQMSNSSGPTSRVVITKRYSAKKFHGVTDVMDNPELQGTAGSNPTEQAYYHIIAGPIDNAADAAVINVNVRITYIVKFHEPKYLDGS